MSTPLGALFRIKVTFTVFATGLVFDPDTTIARVLDPTGVETVYTFGVDLIVKDASGTYHLDILGDSPGEWRYRWEASGSVLARSADGLHIVDNSVL